MTSGTDAVLTSDDFADNLKIVMTVLHELAQQSCISARKVSRHLRLPNAAIERWLERLGAGPRTIGEGGEQ